jgi:hypothetical protein
MSKPTKTEITKMKKSELCEALLKCDLSNVGQRPELQKRLVDYYYGNSTKISTEEKKEIINTNDKPKELILNKSTIKLMKKADLVTNLQKLHLSTVGNRSDLVIRLENYYRPSKTDVIIMNKAMEVFKAPSKSQISSMSKSQLTETLNKLNLVTCDSSLIMSKTLMKHYHPNDDETNEELQVKENIIKPKKKEKDYIDMEVLIHGGREIGVDQDTMEIYEPDNGKYEENCEWSETGLKWSIEHNKPIPV